MAKIKLMKVTDRLTVSQAFSEFLGNCKLKNLTQATITSYTQHFKKFQQFLQQDMDVSFLSQKVINDYLLHLQDTSDNPESINSNIRHIRAVLNFCADNNYCQPFKIKLLKFQQKLKETYSEQELSIMLKKPNIKLCDFTEYRNWVMINFITATGCRISSVVNIKKHEIDLDNAMVTLSHTKNKSAQILPLPPSLVSVLKEYTRYRQSSEGEFLFCNNVGNILLPHSASKAIADYNRSRGISKTSVHLLRHAFAKNWVLMGGDVFRLQKQLGHSTLEMSRRYANIYDRDLHKGTEQFNLLEKLKQGSKSIKMNK
jgi:integrase/recombinase XerD